MQTAVNMQKEHLIEVSKFLSFLKLRMMTKPRDIQIYKLSSVPNMPNEKFNKRTPFYKGAHCRGNIDLKMPWTRGIRRKTNLTEFSG